MLPEEPEKKNKKDEVKLEFKDYIAFIIALLQTVLLPMIFFMIVLCVLAIVFITLV